MSAKTAGDVLRQAREKAKLSQGEVAEKMGYSNPQFVSNWERELCSLPPKKALLFCQITGMKQEAMKALLEKEAMKKLSTRFLGAPKKRAAKKPVAEEAKK